MTKIFNRKEELYLELVLIINDNLYNENKINYYTYKVVEEKLLQKIKTMK